MLKSKYALPLAVLYTLILTVLSLISMDGMPSIGTDYDDKIYHLIAYFLLAVLWFSAFSDKVFRNKIVIIVSGCIAFGIIIEAIQGKLTADRVGDILDIIANIIGVLIGTYFMLRKKKKLS